MTDLPPPIPPATLPEAYNPESDHLRTLSIFWYIIAALKLVVACFALLYLAIGVILAILGVAAGTVASSASHEPGAAIIGVPWAGMGLIVSCFGTFVLALVLVLAFLDFKVARSLKNRRSHSFCFVMACLVCMSFPFGTILGIFTLITLNRPSVRASFS